MIQGSLPTKVCNIKKNQPTFPGQLSCKGTPFHAYRQGLIEHVSLSNLPSKHTFRPAIP
jgi:hypothetical protein